MEEGFVVWFTGAEDSGKEEMAEVLEGYMLERGMDVELFTDSIIREDFADEETPEEIVVKRAIHLAQLLSRNNVPAIFALPAKKAELRMYARESARNFVEVFCEGGNTDDFESPQKTEVIISKENDEDENAELILRTIAVLGYLPKDAVNSEYSDEEEEKIKKRLADLGYI